MSSIFKNFMKSRPKRNKARSTTPVNFNCDPPEKQSSSSIYTKKCQPQQLQFSQTSSEDTHDNEYPSRRRSKSFGGIEQTPSKERKHLFKGLRRKSNRHYDPPGSMTPDTVASSSYAPPISRSEHERIRSLRESYPSGSFDEAHDLAGIDLVRKSSQDRPQRRRTKSIDESNTSSEAAPAKPRSSKSLSRMASDGDDKPISDSKPTTSHNHQTTTSASKFHITNKQPIPLGKRSSSNTKTVIMNGDIVLTTSLTSKSSFDTATIASAAPTITSAATITSASSASKAKAMRRNTERNSRAASALDEKANDLFERGYFDKAMACYTKALKLKRRTFAHLLEDFDELGDDFIIRDDDGNPADPQALVSMATSINNIGYLRQRSGDATPEETMAAYVKSLRIKRRILGNDSLSVGKTLNNIGSVHYLKRDFEKALNAYEEALEIMKANLGDKHPDVATVMSNIGDVYLAKREKDTAVKYYRLALAIRWEAFGEKSPRVVRLLEKISNLEIGDMTQQMANQLASKDDEDASEHMAGSDYPPVTEALRMLQISVQNDIARLDQMEKDAAIETLKDKIILIRGMRECWNGTGPELLDNDCASVQTAMSRLSGR